MSKKLQTSSSTDLRVRRTHKLLWEALLALLKDHPYESITVQEICDKAMVHRTTFYNHFEDKDHLLQHGLNMINDLFAKRSVRERILYPIQTAESIMREHNLQSLMACESNGVISRLMYKQGMDGLLKDLREIESQGTRFPLPLEVIASFYTGARISLIAWWVDNGQQESAAQIDQYLQMLINQKLFDREEKTVTALPQTKEEEK
ncbi:TetR/AcrR family transcriptional regulator [Cohnella sp. AR92]|uniref:TetR/AcrR family transcriptional regulator n=1 Tax=Cohnella sp. AR92 TaxID=648716 RepID=UPI000F8C4A15|nr:TetR/AcrR family transcriptional regulator [Cohnella sp. AR92]RUS45425.1 TetR/AcrR family transcriptional regulator [Cohnella sp. AR92]